MVNPHNPSDDYSTEMLDKARTIPQRTLSSPLSLLTTLRRGGAAARADRGYDRARS